MVMKNFWSTAGAIAVLAALIGLTPASAQGPSLAGKTVNVIIGFGTGGGYDLWGRAVARHIGRHLPGNPNVVAQNMPGAGSFNAANHIYSVAPKDGTAIALITGDAALGPLTGATGARFDSTKFTWVGTPTTDTSLCMVIAASQARTLEDVYQKEIVMGSVGTGIGAYTYPKVLNALLGMKFKIILGFPASSNMLLAMERGEIDGYFASLDSVVSLRPDWIPTKKVRILFYGAATPNPAMKDVPFVGDLAKTADDKAAIEFLYAGNGMGRPFIAPPGVPADRAKMLQDAFMATMRDPEFIADLKKQKFEAQPKDGAYLTALIKKVYGTPAPIRDKVRALMK
jgi:tripartite-type tricarboxylate transporter receptor subunit TctC